MSATAATLRWLSANRGSAARAAATVDRLRTAMLAADADPRGRLVLQGIGFNGIEAAQDAEWADIRALGIRTLAALLQG